MINVYYTASDNVFFEPEPLHKNLQSLVSQGAPGSNVFLCPAFKNSLKNIYCVRAVNDYEFTWIPPSDEFPEGNILSSMHNRSYMEKYIEVRNSKEGFISYRDPPMLFFAETSLEAEQLPAYYHTNSVTSLITITGTYDIGKHLRKFESAFQVKDKRNPCAVKINTGDILYYVKFYTDKKINLVRFTHTPELANLYEQPLFYKSTTRRIVPLRWYYNYVTANGYRKKYLEIIRKNILEKE